MRALSFIILLGMLLPACSTLRDTASATDDVYHVPDRAALAAARATAPEPGTAPQEDNDYYDPARSGRFDAFRDYYDLTYNDPYYYNHGRFGFGTGIGTYGPSYGMGLSYGWPTSFGSMSLYYGTGYGLYGYNPYWGNSWMSGYGYSPYGYDPYGYYGYGNYGYGYGGYGMGYGPYYSPWGRCQGCYEPVGYGNSIYTHRPSMAGSSPGSGSLAPEPRRMRNPASLMTGTPSPLPQTSFGTRPTDARPARTAVPATPAKTNDVFRDTSRPANRPEARPERTRTFDTPSSPGGGGSFGGGGGGGRVTSPRPR